MPRYILLAYFCLYYFSTCICQIHHHETGKVFPFKYTDTVYWNSGTYQNYPALYGTLIVKENRENRDSKIITIPVIKILAVNTNTCDNPIFILNGGPGESNISTHLFSEKLIQNHDIIMVGYRGVDGSVKLDCKNIKSSILDTSINISNCNKIFNSKVKECIYSLIESGVDITAYSMNNVIYDIEAVRKCLNYNKISLLSFSYGTMLSQLYQDKYEDHLDKIVMVAARPLNDFIFKSEEINDMLYTFHKEYCTTSQKIELDKYSTIDSLNKLIKCNLHNTSKFNEVSLLVLLFSKLYNYHNATIFFETLKNSCHDNDDLIKTYNTFYKSFLTENTIGDIIIKKQGRLNALPEKIDTATTGGKISYIINSLYSPIYDTNKVYQEVSGKIHNNPILFISGEYDIVSPSYKIKPDLTSQNTQAEFIEIAKSSHLDLFLSRKDTLESIMYDFFTN